MDNELQDVASQIDNFKNSVIQLIQAQGFEFRRKPTKDGSIVVEAFPKFITPKLDSIPKMLRAIKILRLDKNPIINSTFTSMTEAINNAKTNIFRRKEITKEIEIIFTELPSRRKDNKLNEKEVKKDLLEEKKDTKLEKIVKDMVANLEALEDTKEYKQKCKQFDTKANVQNLTPDCNISHILTPEEFYNTNVKPKELCDTNSQSTTFKYLKNPQPHHYQSF
jgi:hypothetical protein